MLTSSIRDRVLEKPRSSLTRGEPDVFTTVFPRARQLSVPIQMNPGHAAVLFLKHPLQYYPSQLHIVLTSGLFRPVLSNHNPLCILFSPLRTACPAHIVLLDLVALIISEEYNSWSPSLCSFIQSPVTFYSVGPNIWIGITFSNILILCS